MKSGIELIAAERQRQISEEGWTKEHDQIHDDGSLAIAAACYALPDNLMPLSDKDTLSGGVFLSIKRYSLWPWDWKWWKPSRDNRIKELVKAGALIVAEIDRLNNVKP